jgi:hypothetical protein
MFLYYNIFQGLDTRNRICKDTQNFPQTKVCCSPLTLFVKSWSEAGVNRVGGWWADKAQKGVAFLGGEASKTQISQS